MAQTSRTRLTIIPVGIVAALIGAAIAVPVHFNSPDALRALLRRAGTGAVVTLTVYNVPSRSRRIERVHLRSTTKE
jgi:uncharacterized membrane protein YeaQ/YmgE (transglycosylase-associated protein family)